jgi:hypothetical protein
MSAHAVSTIDSCIGGFVLQETNLPFETPEEIREVAGGIREHLPAGELPYLTEMIVEHALQPGEAFDGEFRNGLDLILDAIDARRG